MTPDEQKPKVKIQRIGGYLHRIVPIIDSAGKVVGHISKPFMVEVKFRDVMQMIIGATILAIPVGFTEEAWNLSAQLPTANVLILSFISLLFVSLFVYFNFYRYNFQKYKVQFFKRSLGIYIISLLVVGCFLTIIQKCPWGIDNILALKRIIIVAMPASMSAAVSDMLK
jgi:uncharacterized membrane protein